MPVGDRQAFIVRLIEKVLGERAELNPTFPWLLNRHAKEEFGKYFEVIDRIHSDLKGMRGSVKKVKKLRCDAYFGGSYNFILEFDEFQHFSSARARVLRMLPREISYGFDRAHYLGLCSEHGARADSYRSNKRTLDFCFSGGRTAQRAYLDAFRDILPGLYGLRPTVRISEFEVSSISRDTPQSRRALRDLVEKKAQQALARDVRTHARDEWR